VKEPNMFQTMKLRKSLVKPVTQQKNLQLYRVVRFFRPRSSRTTHLMLFSERSQSCMTISGGRTEQHVIIGFGELAAVD